MLLKSLRMKDFRQFKGEQCLEFATDKVKNVTIILGDNGTGKTTLAQIFTWCLYGETSFEDKVLLCRAKGEELSIGEEAWVEAELTLIHSGIEYKVESKQKYFKDNTGNIKSKEPRNAKMTYKDPDGTTGFIRNEDIEERIIEILPQELSKYFFFDGERIGNMSKEIKRGRSKEFASAVHNLLGLGAYKEALSHLKDRGKTNVYAWYEDSYDSTSDKKIKEYSNSIKALNEKSERIEKRLDDIDFEKELAIGKISQLDDRILENEMSNKLAEDRKKKEKEYNDFKKFKHKQTKDLLSNFNKSISSYFAKRLMKDALDSLSKAEKIDKGVPNVNDETIEFLLKREKCICGTKLLPGDNATISLIQLLEYIPPKSIGNMISDFVTECGEKGKSIEGFYEDFRNDFKTMREYESYSLEKADEIRKIEDSLEKMENIGSLQTDRIRYEKKLRDLEDEKERLTFENGGHTTKKKELEAARQELAIKNEVNRNIEIYKAYVECLYKTLADQYKTEEDKMRKELEKIVNELFLKIYTGGLSLNLDESYSIQINVVDQKNGVIADIETSTAQSISVILAFIAGVIKLARKSQEASEQSENEHLKSEPYPLVMDAPLSAYDKTRIKTVCEVLPAVAEQVIIIIKDTDGELAEKYLNEKIGAHYNLIKHSEFEVVARVGG